MAKNLVLILAHYFYGTEKEIKSKASSCYTEGFSVRKEN